MPTTPKKIFITIPWFTPAFKAGGPIRSVSNLIHHVTEGVQYFIFTSNTDLDGKPLDKIEKDTWYKFNDYTTIIYTDNKRRSNLLINEVKKIQPDTIMAIGMYSWHFTVVPIFYCKAEQKILSVRGMLHSAALQKKAFKKNLYLAALKAFGINNKTSFHATDEVEAGFIKEVFGMQSRIFLAQNIPTLINRNIERNKEAGSLVMTSICLLGPMKNILLVLQALKFCTGNILYHIYGVITDRVYWAECLHAITALPANIKVQYLGELKPDEIATALQNADIYIQPSASENYGHSIAEALSAGLPVITSRFTPWNDLLNEKAGVNVTLDPAVVAEEINFFTKMDTQEFSLWQESARKYLEKHEDMFATISAYKEMFDLP